MAETQEKPNTVPDSEKPPEPPKVEQPAAGKIIKVEVVGEDPLTGKKYNKVVEIDLNTEEGQRAIENAIRKAERFEAKMGALNKEIDKKATERAREMLEQLKELEMARIQAMREANKTTDEMGIPLPTQEELLNDPSALKRYMDAREKAILDRIEQQRILEKQEEEEIRRETELYNEAVNKALEDFDVPRSILVRELKSAIAEGLEPDGVYEFVKNLYEEIYGAIDLEKIPAAKREAYLKKIEESRTAPKAPPSGADHKVEETPADSIEEVIKREKRKYGWK